MKPFLRSIGIGLAFSLLLSWAIGASITETAAGIIGGIFVGSATKAARLYFAKRKANKAI